MELNQLYDVTIIGGGPVGLFTAFYAGMRELKTKIIESLDIIGGQPAHLYPTKFIYDIPAHYKISGVNLIQALTEQLSHFDTTICTGEEALDIVHHNNGEFSYYEISTNKGTHYTRSIVIAIGNGAFKPRKLALENAASFEQTNLHYFVHDPNTFADKVVAICGGGDSAVDWALMLEPIAKEVHLIHRRPQFRAMEHSITALNASSVHIHTPFLPSKLHGDTHIREIELTEARSDVTKHLQVDDFIVSYGYVSSIGEVSKWGFDLQHQTILTQQSMTTNLPGVYAVGDIAQYPGKAKLIATGFGEATNAINHVVQFLYPEKSKATIHSTSLFE